MMNKQILLAGFVIAAPILNLSAEPGGIYTLTGKEKSIDEIVKADVKKHPELYKGENINIYIARFKHENKLGNRKLYPGGQLRFPETRASTAKKKAAVEEKEQQEEQARKALYASFHENLETDWVEEKLFDELVVRLGKEGVGTRHWPTLIEGRCKNGKSEYRVKYEKAPDEGRFEFCWAYSCGKEYFDKECKMHRNNGLELIHQQTFTDADGDVQYQAIWRMHET